MFQFYVFCSFALPNAFLFLSYPTSKIIANLLSKTPPCFETLRFLKPKTPGGNSGLDDAFPFSSTSIAWSRFQRIPSPRWRRMEFGEERLKVLLLMAIGWLIIRQETPGWGNGSWNPSHIYIYVLYPRWLAGFQPSTVWIGLLMAFDGDLESCLNFVGKV